MWIPTDVRAGWRAVARTPGFAALAIATMALGIGSTTTVYGVMRAVLLRPLPFPAPERLVTVWQADPAGGVSRQPLTAPNFVDWSAQTAAFEATGAVPNWTGSPVPFNVTLGATTLRVPGVYASSGLFAVLAVAPALGRALEAGDDRIMGSRHVVVSHAFWRDQLGRRPDVVGSRVNIDTFRGGDFVIVGVMPEGFDFPNGTRLWLSLADWGGGPLPGLDAAERCCPWYSVFARLRPGISPARASEELSVLARRISARHPHTPRVSQVIVEPLRESLAGSHRIGLTLLFGAVGCLLLASCANLANLLLTRAVGRRHELATRVALGARPWQLSRQLVAESVTLCGLGAAAGLLVAGWTQRALAHGLAGRVPLIEQARIDLSVTAFAVALSLACGVLCGLAPIVGFRGLDLRARGATEGRRSRRLRQALVVAEVALTVTLLASAGLLVRTLVSLRAVDLGFERDRILRVALDLTTEPLRSRGQAAQFLRELLPRVSALPGVQHAGASTGPPLEMGSAAHPITREDRPPQLAADSPLALHTAVTPGYFAALGVPVLSGRVCSDADTAEGVLVAVLNDTAARRYWPGENPIGKRFAYGSRERFGFFRSPAVPGGIEWREIVGIVADVRSEGFAADVQPEVFHCYQQFWLYEPKLFVRARSDPLTLVPAVRREIALLNPRAVIVDIRTFDQIAADSVTDERTRAVLVGAFSATALLLGMLGIYGLLAYSVGQRVREIGIRLALGASRAELTRLVVGQALRLTAVGIAIGLAGALAAGQLMAGLLFGVQPMDVPSLAAAGVVTLLAALLASSAPARRAARVTPAAVLERQ